MDFHYGDLGLFPIFSYKPTSVSATQYYSIHISYSCFINHLSTLHIVAFVAVVIRIPPSTQ